jgi:3-oxoadipate enol-lactonase
MTELPYRGSDGWPLLANVIEQTGATEAGGTPLVLLHGGGPDHHMFLPLARELADLCTVVLPDVRGYGQSICADLQRHTWAQYADDVISLLDHIGAGGAIIGGAGLGATIALRTALAYPGRVHALVLISVEAIEDDAQKKAEIAFMDAFAERVRTRGIEAAWAPILRDLAPVIGALVRDAIPRSDPMSIAAAAALGHARAVQSVNELAAINAPTLLFPGMDERHPAVLADQLARLLPRGRFATASLSAHVRSAEEFARAFAPTIREFLIALPEDENGSGGYTP